ncbi:hypothetical protein H5410_055992 [Solanum commersonii]|uniref:Uncharacterized protein n=1 Tax=Solanum commersonii TaxID=4109 RepID=A0A9J5WJZ6_SOLCO|nr:hypothetical protein H5410_055992 [Solanum commersonii]
MLNNTGYMCKAHTLKLVLSKYGVNSSQSLNKGVIPIETPHPRNKINLTKIQDLSNESSPDPKWSTSMINPVSTNFRSLFANDDSSEPIWRDMNVLHVVEANGPVESWNPRQVTVKTLLTGYKVSRIANNAKIKFQALANKKIEANQKYEFDLFEMMNIERSNLVRLSIAQNTIFRPYNLQNNCNHENHKGGQVILGSLQEKRLQVTFKKHNFPNIKRDFLPPTRSAHHFSYMEIQVSTMAVEIDMN